MRFILPFTVLRLTCRLMLSPQRFNCFETSRRVFLDRKFMICHSVLLDDSQLPAHAVFDSSIAAPQWPGSILPAPRKQGGLCLAVAGFLQGLFLASKSLQNIQHQPSHSTFESVSEFQARIPRFAVCIGLPLGKIGRKDPKAWLRLR